MLKIEVRGQRKAVEKAERVLASQLNQIEQMSEAQARLKLQDIIDEDKLVAHIIVNGNFVWSMKRILQNLRRIRDAGKLYDDSGQRPGRELVGNVLWLPVGTNPILSKYFYEFLELECGSAAHYNIHGWIAEYPTLEDLKRFFRKNEFGHRVLDYIPSWKTDAKRIVEAIEIILFPLESYVRSKKRASFSVGVKNKHGNIEK
jgi:hypothetical protein